MCPPRSFPAVSLPFVKWFRVKSRSERAGSRVVAVGVEVPVAGAARSHFCRLRMASAHSSANASIQHDDATL